MSRPHSVLGSGAVGIGDMLGNSNVSLIMACAKSDGTLLSPSRPSTYIDAVYLPSGSQFWPVNDGRIFQAPSFIPTGTGSVAWMSVLAVDIAVDFGLLPSDLYPDLSGAAPGAKTQIHHISS